ncbi:MAG: hypothetical protein ABI760_21540 [Ferruginibacter sp.]
MKVVYSFVEGSAKEKYFLQKNNINVFNTALGFVSFLFENSGYSNMEKVGDDKQNIAWQTIICFQTRKDYPNHLPVQFKAKLKGFSKITGFLYFFTREAISC